VTRLVGKIGWILTLPLRKLGGKVFGLLGNIVRKLFEVLVVRSFIAVGLRRLIEKIRLILNLSRFGNGT